MTLHLLPEQITNLPTISWIPLYRTKTFNIAPQTSVVKTVRLITQKVRRILGNFLILLFNTFMMEKVPNVLKKWKIFFFATH